MPATPVRRARAALVVAATLAVGASPTTAAAAAPSQPLSDSPVAALQGKGVKPKGKLAKAVRRQSGPQRMMGGTWLGPYCTFYRYSTRTEALCQWEYIGGGGQWITYQQYFVNHGRGWIFTGSDVRYI